MSWGAGEPLVCGASNVSPSLAGRDTRTQSRWGNRRLPPAVGGEMPRAPGLHPREPWRRWLHCPQKLLWVGLGCPGRPLGGIPGHWAAPPGYCERVKGVSLSDPHPVGTSVSWGQAGGLGAASSKPWDPMRQGRSKAPSFPSPPLPPSGLGCCSAVL